MIFISNDFFFTHSYGYDCVTTIVSKEEVVQLNCGWCHCNKMKKNLFTKFINPSCPYYYCHCINKVLFTFRRRGRFTNNYCCCEPIGTTSLPDAFINMSNLLLCTPSSVVSPRTLVKKVPWLLIISTTQEDCQSFFFFNPMLLLLQQQY
jgi:hypothetical protein